MKRMLVLLLAVLMAAGLPLSMSGCASKAPKVEVLYDRVVELVEASYALNEAFYGAGLPYYDRALSPYRFLYSDYATEQYTKDYNIVSSHARYNSIETLKYEAAKVYTPQLLAEVVYPSAFEGLVISGVGSSMQFASARYQEGNEDFYIYAGEQEASPTPLVYDYATMEIVRPSNAEKVLISLSAWEETSPDRPMTVRLSLALVDGVWLLDKLTV